MTEPKPPRSRRKSTRPGPELQPPNDAAGLGWADIPAEPDAPAALPEIRFPIVGVGASAGGLAAFEAFFSAMPATSESGMAIILVQHLAPDHKSILTDLVKRYTLMRVFEAKHGMVIQPNCVYIIPPNRELTLLNGTLHLIEPTAPHSQRMLIDVFFHSLAEDQRERAICVVLSGMGNDGTLGVRAIKAAGGMIIAQDPDTTAYDGMPRSAIATGMVNYVLPPATIPAQLFSYVAQAFGTRPHPPTIPAPSVQGTLAKICVVLRAQTGRDFSQYKENTLIRRVERRMGLHQIEQASDYLQYLQHQPAEVEALFRDLLIGVTSFFRDPEAFGVLETLVIPRLFAARHPDTQVRVWVCGCSTGEEAYSLAILFQEHLETLKQPIKVQIFATDLDGHAIELARSGSFPASIAADMTPGRLERYFIQDAENGRYRACRVIRDLLIFSAQDVIGDPPFSRLDMISCRNLLIYLNMDLQKKLIPLFHYALNPHGVLFLGTSETIGEFVTLFTPVDRTWKIYVSQADIPGAARPALSSIAPRSVEGAIHPQRLGVTRQSGDQRNLRMLTEQTLLAHIDVVGVLVTEQGDILHIFGRTGNYLEPAPGDAALNILAMAREGLRRELTIALHKAIAQHEPIHYPGLRVRTNGSFSSVNLTVRPVVSHVDGIALADLFLVILEEVPPESPVLPDQAISADQRTPAAIADQRIAALEQELQANEEYLQTALEEMETSNEELQSANEELQSVNEEIQSTNEELETSKEELQSVNEELATINAELQHKVTDLLRANNDMNNLLAGTGVGTLFVDFQLRIARFTPSITQIINIIQTDIGRPVSDIVSNLRGYDRLIGDVQMVLESLIPQEMEVQNRVGAWYLMRIRPYRTLDNVIEGAVITFIDITQRKQIEAALVSSEAKFAKAFRASPDGLVISRRADGAILDVNDSWEQMVGYSRLETLEHSLLELKLFVNPDDWQQIIARLQDQESLHNRELEIRHKSGQARWVLVSVEQLDLDTGPGLLTIIRDITERKRKETDDKQ